MKIITAIIAGLLIGLIASAQQQQQPTDEQLCELARRADAERLSRQIQRLQGTISELEKINKELADKIKKDSPGEK